VPRERRTPMKWFFHISGSGNRKVKDSEPVYDTEAQAMAAGNEYLKNNKASCYREDDPQEVFMVAAGRKEP
jgi:hypothetical protein